MGGLFYVMFFFQSINNLNMKYIISTKWTHRNDAFITLWRPDNNGYCWYQAWAGKYDIASWSKVDREHYDNCHSTIAIDCEIIDNLFVTVKFDNRIEKILPNTDEVLEILNIDRKLFDKLYPSSCPNIKELSLYLFDKP